MFAHTNLITYESLYSSSYLLNENLLYDKLWGPSQRVVTLFVFVNSVSYFLGHPVDSICLCRCLIINFSSPSHHLLTSFHFEIHKKFKIKYEPPKLAIIRMIREEMIDIYM